MSFCDLKWILKLIFLFCIDIAKPYYNQIIPNWYSYRDLSGQQAEQYIPSGAWLEQGGILAPPTAFPVYLVVIHQYTTSTQFGVMVYPMPNPGARARTEMNLIKINVINTQIYWWWHKWLPTWASGIGWARHLFPSNDYIKSGYIFISAHGRIWYVNLVQKSKLHVLLIYAT